MNIFFARCLAMACALAITAPATEAAAQTASNLACSGCVGKKDIGKKAVTKKAVGKNAVTRKAIGKNAVNAARLAGNAQPAGVEYESLAGSKVEIGAGHTVITTVNVKAPSTGFVVAMMSGYLSFTGVTNLVYCGLTTGTEIDFEHSIAAWGSGDADESGYLSPIAQTRVFPVSKGPGTYNLVCAAANAAPVGVWNTSLTALYVPASY
jgi:hypothetical protein